MRLVAIVAALVSLASAVEHKNRYEIKKDHGVDRIRSLVTKFRKEYEKPISARVLVLTDEHYNKLKHRSEEISSYNVQY